MRLQTRLQVGHRAHANHTIVLGLSQEESVLPADKRDTTIFFGTSTGDHGADLRIHLSISDAERVIGQLQDAIRDLMVEMNALQSQSPSPSPAGGPPIPDPDPEAAASAGECANCGHPKERHRLRGSGQCLADYLEFDDPQAGAPVGERAVGNYWCKCRKFVPAAQTEGVSR